MEKIKKKIAIISGISGQDGSYLAELLVKKKYIVYGVTNPKSKNKLNIINSIKDKIIIEKLDLNNYKKVATLIKRIKPTEFYHLAA